MTGQDLYTEVYDGCSHEPLTLSLRRFSPEFRRVPGLSGAIVWTLVGRHEKQPYFLGISRCPEATKDDNDILGTITSRNKETADLVFREIMEKTGIAFELSKNAQVKALVHASSSRLVDDAFSDPTLWLRNCELYGFARI